MHWFFEKALAEAIEDIQAKQVEIKQIETEIKTSQGDILGHIRVIEADIHSITDVLQNKIDALTAQILENDRKMREAMGTVVKVPEI